MSREHSSEAERVLMRIRASADPAPGADRRVLAGVEQRIAIEGDVPRVGSPTAGKAPLVSVRAARWRQASQVAARLGRWGAFGIIAGTIGYHLGSTEHDRTETASAGVVESASARSAAGAAAAAAPVPSPVTVAPAMVAPATASSPAISPPVVSPPVVSPAQLEPSTRAGSNAAAQTRTSARAASSERREARAVAQSIGARPLDLAEVIERLLRAQASVRAGDPHAALQELEALDASDHGSPGVLVDERLVVRALALCDIGRIGDARRVLSALDRLGADSIYRGRLEQGCPAALAP